MDRRSRFGGTLPSIHSIDPDSRRGSQDGEVSYTQRNENKKTIRKLRSENQKLKRLSFANGEELRLLSKQFQEQLIVMRAMKMHLVNVASMVKHQKSIEAEMAAKVDDSVQLLSDLETHQEDIAKFAGTIVAPSTVDDEPIEFIPSRTLEEQNLFYSEKVLETYNLENEGADFALDEALVSFPFSHRDRWIIHLNFTAKDQAGAVHLVFGEVVSEDKPEDQPEVLSYCILSRDANGDYSSLTKGCAECDPDCLVPIYHPDRDCFKLGNFDRNLYWA
ncbi:unnamed protein product [Linum trigynum]|uniref:DUF3615 domain-containing protein n=1 Tax=Linum trigynum TaxID=586398 RepID=A0AAV2G609_9ROSI